MLNTLVGTPLFLSPKLFVAYATNQPGKVKYKKILLADMI
jgi:hypothetical protein